MDIDKCWVVWDEKDRKILSVHTLKTIANSMRSDLIEIERESDPTVYMRYHTPTLAHALGLLKAEAVEEASTKKNPAYNTGDGIYCPIDRSDIYD